MRPRTSGASKRGTDEWPSFRGPTATTASCATSLSAGVTAVPAATGTLTGVSNVIDGGAGNDTIEAGDGEATTSIAKATYPSAAPATIPSPAAADDDFLDGDDGNDVIWGGGVAGYLRLHRRRRRQRRHPRRRQSSRTPSTAAPGPTRCTAAPTTTTSMSTTRAMSSSKPPTPASRRSYASILRYTLPANVEALEFDFSRRD